MALPPYFRVWVGDRPPIQRCPIPHGRRDAKGLRHHRLEPHDLNHYRIKPVGSIKRPTEVDRSECASRTLYCTLYRMNAVVWNW